MLELELAVLGKLVHFVTGNQGQPTRKQSVTFDNGKNLDHEVQEFVASQQKPK
jgi:hypothetical protein